jgi:hypothetical protein
MPEESALFSPLLPNPNKNLTGEAEKRAVFSLTRGTLEQVFEATLRVLACDRSILRDPADRTLGSVICREIVAGALFELVTPTPNDGAVARFFGEGERTGRYDQRRRWKQWPPSVRALIMHAICAELRSLIHLKEYHDGNTNHA